MAVYVDLRNSIIPNRIVVLILVIQVIRGVVSCSSYSADMADRLYRLITRCIVVFIFLFLLYIFFSIGAVGAGDLKLLAVTAIGFERPAEFIAVTFIIAAALSLVHAIRKHVLLQRIKYLLNYVLDISMTKNLKGYFDAHVGIEERKEYSIHFSFPILLTFMVMEAVSAMI